MSEGTQSPWHIRTDALKWFDPIRQFGFILNPGVGDVHIHKDAIINYDEAEKNGWLKPGVKVRYEMVWKMKAVRAEILPPEEA